jgi:hypothetical protein
MEQAASEILTHENLDTKTADWGEQSEGSGS